MKSLPTFINRILLVAGLDEEEYSITLLCDDKEKHPSSQNALSAKFTCFSLLLQRIMSLCVVKNKCIHIHEMETFNMAHQIHLYKFQLLPHKHMRIKKILRQGYLTQL